ncbi:hypothetical protein C8R43DRAFT_961241 [Mycena crocata]|nr:hypothetical protein C8R43DRAFT_961241 [Mycena crocata]
MPTLVNNQVGAHLPVTHTYQTRSLVVKERLNLKPRRRLVLKTPRISATRLRKFVHGGSGMGDPWTMEDADGITRGCSWGDPTPMTPAVLNSGQMVQTSITVRDTTLEWVRGGKVKARACGKSVTKRPSAKAAPDGVGGWRNTRKHPAIGVYVHDSPRWVQGPTRARVPSPTRRGSIPTSNLRGSRGVSANEVELTRKRIMSPTCEVLRAGATGESRLQIDDHKLGPIEQKKLSEADIPKLE